MAIRNSPLPAFSLGLLFVISSATGLRAQSFYGSSSFAPIQPFYPAQRASAQYAYYRVPEPRFEAPDDEATSAAPAVETSGGGFGHPMVRGNRAVVRNGVAYAPSNAPEVVKQAIWATNSIRRKPYKWGGGHGSFEDSGYDCSGTVSFALHHAGVLSSPIPSNELRSFGERGRGRWITIYSRNGHTFAVIAGLRLDTTGFYGNEGPRWRTDGRDTWGFDARHPVGL